MTGIAVDDDGADINAASSKSLSEFFRFGWWKEPVVGEGNYTEFSVTIGGESSEGVA